MNTIWIIIILVVYIPAVLITDLPILFSKDKYTMDYIMMILGLIPVYNVFTAICSVFCMQDEWKNLLKRHKNG